MTFEQAKSQYSPVKIGIGGGPLVVKPNISNQIPITASNLGEETITVEFEISGQPITWFNTQQVPKLKELKPDEQYTFQVPFETPANAKTGSKQAITIKAIPKENSKMADGTKIEVEIGPKASFEYLKNNANPLEVSFENFTIGNANSWHWNFGDGSTSTEKSPPSHTYQKSEEHTITLTATGPHGSSTYSRKISFSN